MRYVYVNIGPIWSVDSVVLTVRTIQTWQPRYRDSNNCRGKRFLSYQNIQNVSEDHIISTSVKRPRREANQSLLMSAVIPTSKPTFVCLQPTRIIYPRFVSYLVEWGGGRYFRIFSPPELSRYFCPPTLIPSSVTCLQHNTARSQMCN